MLHVLLILLKIIGILLAFLICLVVLFLVVPIRYSFRLEKKETVPFHGKLKVTWFFILLYMKASYIDEVFDYQVRIFGYQIMGNQAEFLSRKERKEQKKEEKKRKKEKSKNQASDSKSGKIAVNEKKILEKQTLEKQIESSKGTDLTGNTVQDKNKIEKNQNNKENKVQQPEEEKLLHSTEKQEKSKRNITGKIQRIKDKIQSIITSIKNKIKSGRNILVSIRQIFSKYKTMYAEYHGQELIVLAKDCIMKSFNHILPKRLKGNIRYGFDDPAATGYVTGAAAVFYPKYQKSFSLEPDFQESCFEAYCKGRGRIRIGFFVYLGIRALLNKDILKLMKHMKDQ